MMGGRKSLFQNGIFFRTALESPQTLLRAVIVSTLWLIVAAPATSKAAPMYVITDLGALPGGSGCYAMAVNDYGHVTGYAYTGGRDSFGYNITHAVRYENGSLVDLGTPAGFSQSQAVAMNNTGTVVGILQNPGTGGNHAFKYDGSFVDLGTLPGGSHSRAYSVNSAGEVVGDASTADLGWRAAVFANGTVNDLNSLVHQSSGLTLVAAKAVNDVGQIAGQAKTADGSYRAFLYTGGTVTDLGTIGGNSSVATGINAKGQVIGYAFGSNWTHSFVYSNGMTNDLGTLGGSTCYALGINSDGVIVGQSYTTSSLQHAFLYDNGTMSDLNEFVDTDSGWSLQTASGINDFGQVVGYGLDPTGNTRGFLLTRAEPCGLALSSDYSGLRTLVAGTSNRSAAITVVRPGGFDTAYSLSSPDLNVSPTSGTVPGVSMASVPFSLEWKDTATTGPKSGLISLTASPSDPNNHEMAVSGAVVANRSLTVGSIRGRVMAARAFATQTTTIRSGSDSLLSDDDHETRVNTVAGGTATDGFASVAYQVSPIVQFNAANQAADLNVSFTASSQAGLHHGSLDLTPTMLADGEDSSVGATVHPVNLNYDISVLANRQLTVDAIGGAQAARVVQRTRFVTAIHSGSDPAVDGDDAATRVNTVAGGRTGNAKQKLTVSYAGAPTGQFNDVDQSADVGLTFAKPGRYQGSLNLAPTMLANGEDASVGATVQPAVLNYNINVLEPRRLCAHTNHVQFGNVLRGATVSANYSVHSDNLLADAEHTTMVHVAPGGSALGSLTVGQTLIDAAGNVSVPITGTFDSYEKGVVRGLVPVATAEAAEVQDSTNYKSLKFSYSANVGIAHFGGRPTQFGSGATVLSAAVPSGGRMSELSSKISPTRTLVENATLASAVTSPRDLRGMYGAVGSEATIVDSTALASDATVSMQWRRRTQTEAHYQNRTDPALPDGGWLASDVVKIDGIADSVAYALQMTFDNRINLAIDGPVDGTVANEFAAGQLYLAEFDTTANRWLNAASLVTAGAEAELGVLQSLSDFMAAHVGASLFDLQGSWGVDPLTNDTGLGYAWVITAGSGIFAVDPSGTPATFDANSPGSVGLGGESLSAAGLGAASLAGGMLGNGSLAATSPAAVPEPGTLALVVLAAVSVFALRRDKRRQ